MQDRQPDIGRDKQKILGVGLGVILAAQLFLFMPFSLYIGNAVEFPVSFGSMFSVWLPLAVLLAGCIALAAILLPNSIHTAYLSLLAMVSILIWIQGNLLVWNYGLLDGRSISWETYAGRGWLEIGLWLAALLAAVVAWRKLNQALIRVAIALFLLQTTVFIYSWIQNDSTPSVHSGDANTAALGEIVRFSSKKNVVHIIADGFQSDIFAELTSEGESGNRLRDALIGFKFFREQIGVFPYTHMTIPAILTGKIYRNDLRIKEYMESSVGGKSILSVANDAGYEIDLAVPPGAVENIYSKARYTNFYSIDGQDNIATSEFEYSAAAKLLDLMLFRISPHFVKTHVYNDQLWLVQSLITDKAFLKLRFFSHMRFLKRLHEQMTADRPVPVYKLIHVMLSHRPMVTNEQCDYAGAVLPTVRETVKTQAKCGLLEVVKLLDSMKRLGIYDDATIVLMGDHGAWVPPKGLKAIINPDGRTADYINLSVLALSVPLLAIKRPGDDGPMTVSAAPTWIIDTAATIADVEGFEAKFVGESVFALKGDQSRERSFNYYEYKRSEWNDDYLSPIEEFTVNGSAVDSSSWKYSLTHYPGGRSEKARAKSSLWQTFQLQ